MFRRQHLPLLFDVFISVAVGAGAFGEATGGPSPAHTTIDIQGPCHHLPHEQQGRCCSLLLGRILQVLMVVYVVWVVVAVGKGRQCDIFAVKMRCWGH